MKLLFAQKHVVRIQSACFGFDLLVTSLHFNFPLLKTVQLRLNLVCLDFSDGELHLAVMLSTSFNSESFSLESCMNEVQLLNFALKVHY